MRKLVVFFTMVAMAMNGNVPVLGEGAIENEHKVTIVVQGMMKSKSGAT